RSIKYTYGKTGRLLKSSDSPSQIKKYTYNKDDTVSKIEYVNPNNVALTTTPPVSFTWDTYFRRLNSMTDGIGITNYSYWPIDATPLVGAGRLREVSGPVLRNGAPNASYVI